MKENFDAIIQQAEEQVKERLSSYRSLNQEIDNEIERLERLEAKLYGVGSQNFDGMPKSSSVTVDRISGQLHKKKVLEERIRALMQNRDEAMEAMESLVIRLKNADERAVIRMRYFDTEEWNDILTMLFGKKSDFDCKADNYTQRMFRLHKSAIRKLSEFVIKGAVI